MRKIGDRKLWTSLGVDVIDFELQAVLRESPADLHNNWIQLY